MRGSLIHSGEQGLRGGRSPIYPWEWEEQKERGIRAGVEGFTVSHQPWGAGVAGD